MRGKKTLEAMISFNSPRDLSAPDVAVVHPAIAAATHALDAAFLPSAACAAASLAIGARKGEQET